MNWYNNFHKTSSKFRKNLNELKGSLFDKLGVNKIPVGYVLEQKDNGMWIVISPNGQIIVNNEKYAIIAIRHAIKRILYINQK